MNIKWLARILTSFSIVLTGVLIIPSTANAVGEIVASQPNSNTLNVGETVFTSTVRTYAPIANSRTIKITLESDNSITRTVTTTLGSGTEQITFDPLATGSSLPNNPKIVSVDSNLGPSTKYPNGVYAVTFSWQYSLSGTQTRTQDVLHVSFFASCLAGEFAEEGTTGCTPAPIGSYVGSAGSTTPIPCPAGTYSGTTGLSSCSNASAGHFVPRINSYTEFLCAPDTYQDVTGQSSCKSCPTSYTSPAGSDEQADCIAPVVSTTPTAVTSSPTLGKGKKLKITTLATQIGMSVPAKAKASAKVSKASKKICKVSGSSIKGLKPGACVVTVKVKPKKGSTTTQVTTLTVS